MKKIAVFVDVQNIYYTVKDTFNCHFNYRALWRQLSEYGEICIANAYAIDKNDSQQQAQAPTIDPSQALRGVIPPARHHTSDQPRSRL